MDDFPDILTRDFGFKPQGKSAPMAPPRYSSNAAPNFGLGSGVNDRSSSGASGPVFDDHDRGLFRDVFGGVSTASSSSALDYDSIFKDQKSAKTASLPVFDKPVYDDDIFDGLPGLKTSSSARFDDVFVSTAPASSPPKRKPQSGSPLDDLLGNLGRKDGKSKNEGVRVDKDLQAFDDLIPGFGRSSSPNISRSTSESNRSQKPSSNSVKAGSSMKDDPFVVLESKLTPAASSSGLFTDPLEEISKFSRSTSTKVDNSFRNTGMSDDMDTLHKLGKSVPPASPEINKRGKDRSPLRSGPNVSGTYAPASEEAVDKYPVENSDDHTKKRMPIDDFQESHQTPFDIPTTSTGFHRSTGQTFSPPSYDNPGTNETMSSPRFEEVAESSDDIWLTVSEIPLFTQPTSAPPPSRPPPPRPPRFSKSETGSFSSANSRKKVNDYSSFPNSTHYSQSSKPAQAMRNSVASQIDELEDFAMDRSHNNVNENADFLSGVDSETNSSAAASAAAMKEAMDKAEAKFKQMREREYVKAGRSKESVQLDRDMQDVQQRELRERQERLDRERQQREREEEERELRRLEKERERAREIEREREEKEREQWRLERERERAREIEREKARQAVERATREARERAAAEARIKAERAAKEKAAAEVRERAERAFVQRAQAEARERAAAEARERAEKAAAEARERAIAEAREKEIREKSDARLRAERDAVERAAAEARERAAAAARANQQRNENLEKNNENDLESFFSSRPTSAPRPRANTFDPFFDTQNKGATEVPRTSVGTTSSMRKASSTTNIVDDLSSIFGAAGSSGEFQEVEGESEERRRARMERHQRTQERAAKALAEKNQRDLQAQREQAERHRIAETLDVEIKRWAAGKEGNLRTLLSTLQYVLWPECGWQPVSLTDLITAAAVKKVYRKATLCIHPDKVQQKGANLQQKYIAEKVFDLLKEAWNKFNSEELF